MTYFHLAPFWYLLYCVLCTGLEKGYHMSKNCQQTSPLSSHKQTSAHWRKLGRQREVLVEWGCPCSIPALQTFIDLNQLYMSPLPSFYHLPSLHFFFFPYRDFHSEPRDALPRIAFGALPAVVKVTLWQEGHDVEWKCSLWRHFSLHS